MAALASKLPDHSSHVYLLMDNRLLRETLVRLFRKRLDMCVVGESSPTEAPALEALGDIVVLNDLEAASALGARLQAAPPPASNVGLVLIGMEEEEEQFLTAVRCGVLGFLLNDASASEIVAAIGSVARGEAVCPPRLCFALIRHLARANWEAPSRAKRKPARGLTIRQQQLISLVAKGLTNKQIASQLNLSEFTVKNHIHRIMKQVEAESRHEVAQAARASGFIASA